MARGERAKEAFCCGSAGRDQSSTVRSEPGSVPETASDTSRWLINPADWYGSVLTSRDSLGRLLFIDNVTGSNGPGSIVGIPAVVTTQIASGSAALVDVSRVFIAQDQVPSVALLTERYADQDAIGVRVTTRWDLQLAQPEAAR